jgi:hypothetical protein
LIEVNMRGRLLVAVSMLAGCNLVFGVDEPELVGNPNPAATVTSTSATAGGSSGVAQGGGGGTGGQSQAGAGQGGMPCTATGVVGPRCYDCCVQANGGATFWGTFHDCLCNVDQMPSCVMACTPDFCLGSSNGMGPTEQCLSCILGQLDSAMVATCGAAIQQCQSNPACASTMECIQGC